MKKVILVLALTLMMSSCGSFREINRQEKVILDFLPIYFDTETYLSFECQREDLGSPEFYACIQHGFEIHYETYLSKDLINKSLNLPSSSSFISLIWGGDYSVTYTLITPSNLDHPNIFQVDVYETINGFEREFFINVEVEGETITRFSQHNK